MANDEQVALLKQGVDAWAGDRNDTRSLRNPREPRVQSSCLSPVALGGHTENPIRGAIGKPNKYNDRIISDLAYRKQLITVYQCGMLGCS